MILYVAPCNLDRYTGSKLESRIRSSPALGLPGLAPHPRPLALVPHTLGTPPALRLPRTCGLLRPWGSLNLGALPPLGSSVLWARPSLGPAALGARPWAPQSWALTFGTPNLGASLTLGLAQSSGSPNLGPSLPGIGAPIRGAPTALGLPQLGCHPGRAASAGLGLTRHWGSDGLGAP